MSSFYPRSIVGVILTGFVVVLAPFVAAVITAIVQVERFSLESRSALLGTAQVSEQGQLLVEQAAEMQRALGQYLISADSAFLDIYRDRRLRFRQALSDLGAIENSGIDADRLDVLGTDEARVFDRVDTWNAPLAGPEAEGVRADLASLTMQSRAVLAASEQLVQLSANEMTNRAEELQGLLVVFAAAAVPATVVLIAVFTVLISRPMGELSRAIRRLGAYSYDEAIAVSGPQDIQALAGELEWLRQRIAALEEQKATFLQHISHELKTPLSTIREGSELLYESLEEHNAEEAEIVRLLRQSGLQLHSLIDDLLLFAKTQDLATDLKFEPQVDLARLIEDLCEALSVVVDSKGLIVEASLEPVFASCDAGRIRTVVDNLLTNAVKYTPEGGRIVVQLAERDGLAVVDVADTGPGVAEEERDRIFEPFEQGSARYESSIKGTGLGLSIVREHLLAHGGTIEIVDSEVGAHFRVSFPLAGPEIVQAAH